MRLVHPEILWLLLALPLLGLAGWWSASRRLRALERFAGGPEALGRFRSQVSPHRRAAKQILLYLALALLVFTAARPQWGTRLEPVTRRGSDIVVVLDTSLSMAAEDMAPSRLGYARHAVDSLLARLAGDRVALVTLNDPGRRNAISLALAEEIVQALDGLVSSGDCGALVIIGEPPAFSLSVFPRQALAGTRSPRRKACLAAASFA